MFGYFNRMTMVELTIAFFVIFFFSLSLWSEVSGGRVDVGRGRLRVEGIHLPKDVLNKIEMELLIDEDIAAIVMGSDSLTINIDEESLKKSGDLQGYIKSLIQKRIKSQLVQIRENSEGQTRRHVVMGPQHFVVKDREFYDEVVVMGGKVDVYGTVGTLVVIAGEVRIHGSGVIKEELVTIGGDVEIDPGAEMKNSSVSVDWDFASSLVKSWGSVTDLYNKTDVSMWMEMWLFISELIFNIVILWLCMWLFPHFHRRTQELTVEKPGQSFVLSLLFIVLWVPAVFMLLLSMVGIVLLPLFFSLGFVFLFLGSGEAALWLGSWLNKKLSLVSPKHEILLAIIGIMILNLVMWVPYVGFFVKWGVCTMGFGAVLGAFYQVFLKDPKEAQKAV